MEKPRDLLRWGVLSTANIARKALIPALLKSKNSRLTAVASRDLNKAIAFAGDFGGNIKAHGSYQALLDDHDIDVVYNPTPNHLHLELSLAAIAAGKHVLCEKPIGLNSAEAEQLLNATRQHPTLKVMEAFMYRLHPQWRKVKELVTGGAIGELKHVNTVFTYNNTDPDNVRNQGDIGGGALLDIGCYGISVARWLFDSEPQRVVASQRIDKAFNTDVHTSATLQFERGESTFYCSTQTQWSQSVEIFGKCGKIVVHVPFNPVISDSARITLLRHNEIQRFEYANADHYLEQVIAFENSVIYDLPCPTPLEDAVNNMKVIDAVFASAKRAAWVEIEACSPDH